jgi:hypothetical protein
MCAYVDDVMKPMDMPPIPPLNLISKEEWSELIVIIELIIVFYANTTKYSVAHYRLNDVVVKPLLAAFDIQSLHTPSMIAPALLAILTKCMLMA